MPTEQPSNAPAATAPVPRDEASVGAVLSDPHDDATPGGGGLGGAAAADPLGGSARGGGGASPNSPIDTGVSGGDPSAEARVRAADADAGTPGEARR